MAKKTDKLSLDALAEQSGLNIDLLVKLLFLLSTRRINANDFLEGIVQRVEAIPSDERYTS